MPAMIGSNQAPALKQFALGTSKKWVTVGSVPFGANTSQQLIFPKAGFLGAYKIDFAGSYQNSTGGAAGSTARLWNMFRSITLKNAQGYSYRDLSGDSFYFWNQVQKYGASDSVLGSPAANFGNNTLTTAQNGISFVMTDLIGQNLGINFDKYLISAQTLDDNLTLTLNFGNVADVQVGAQVVSALSGTFTISALYYTVPNLQQYSLPDTTIVQSVIEDTTFTAVVAGQNSVNLTPIAGPEYTGLGLKVMTNGTEDTTDSATNIMKVEVFVNGVDIINTYTAADLIDAQFRHFGRKLPAGWLYIPFGDDIGMVNSSGPIERDVLSTQDYTSVSLRVYLNPATNVSAPSVIKLFKRMQSQIAG